MYNMADVIVVSFTEKVTQVVEIRTIVVSDDESDEDACDTEAKQLSLYNGGEWEYAL